MSTLQFLREKAGVLVAGIIGFSLFLFVVSDFFGRGRGQRLRQKKFYEIGQIGGESVSYQDFETRLQNLLEIYKMSGRENMDDATRENLREQIWQQMVRETILDPQYDKLGVGVSNEEVNELVFGNNPHPIVQQLFTDPETKTFNKSFLVKFLKQTEVDASAKKYWMFFEDEIVNDRMNTKYNDLVAQGLYVTSKQAEFEKNLTADNVDFSYILKNYASVPDSSVKVSQSDLQNYYTAHKENYRRAASRDIEYVMFDVVPSQEDMKEAEQWINKAKEDFAAAPDPVEFINLTSDTRYQGFYVPLKDVPENLRDFVRKEDTKTIFGPYIENGSYKLAKLIAVGDRPDSVHVRHILLTTNQKRSLAVARKEADSLLQLIRKGASFEALAKANSDDQGSAQLGGDLGWFPEGRMVIPFNNACFTSKKGDIKIVETNFGVHIIDVLNESKPVRKYSYGIIERKIVPGSTTNQKVYSEASQFAGTNDTYDKFNKAVAEQKLNKRVATDVAPQQKTLPGLENPRSLIMSLYQTKPGTIVLDNNQQAVFSVDDKYVVAYCTKAQEEGIAPLKNVENDVRLAVVKDKKADVISSQFEKNAGQGKTLDDVARAMLLQVQEATQINFRSYAVPGAGSEPELIAAASAAKQGVLEGPVKGNNGVFMLVDNNVVAAQGEDLKVVRDRLASTYKMRGSYEAYDALRKAANIVDKRYKFY